MNQSTKPIIGITSSIVSYNCMQSVNLHEKYVRSVIQAGGIPIIIPIGTDEMPEVWVSICNGLILSGGEDIDPYSYNADPTPKIRKTNSKRDKIEIGLVKNAQQQNKPILAICRGSSILNVALGGTVLQDIETYIPNAINHYQQAERTEATHEIQIDNTSRMFTIFNSTNIRVNSMHHQAIDTLAETLKIAAVASDGVIEAVERIDQSPVMWGIQWHPEEMASEDPNMQKLLRAFIIECTKVG